MAVSIVKTGTPVAGSSSTSPVSASGTLASAPSASNLVALLVYVNAGGSASNVGPSAATAAITTPSGFTLAGSVYSVSATTGQTPLLAAIYYATGQTATSYSVSATFTGGGPPTVQILVIPFELAGANNTSPSNVAPSYNSHTTTGAGLGAITGPSLTSTVAGCLALGGFFWNDDSAYHGADLNAAAQTSGWTENIAPNPTALQGTNYTGSEVQSFQAASATSGLLPSANNANVNDNGGNPGTVIIGFNWIVAPASSSNVPQRPGLLGGVQPILNGGVLQ